VVILLFATLLVRKPLPGEAEAYEAGETKIAPVVAGDEGVLVSSQAPIKAVGLSVRAALRSRWYLCLLLFKFISSWGYTVFFIHCNAFASDSGS
jgi:hypothetical protein